MNHPTLFIRADASTEIGTGHVMRMMALAQAWEERKRGGNLEPKSRVLFISAVLTEALDARLRKEGFDVARLIASPGSNEDISQTLAIIQQRTKNEEDRAVSRWVAIDGYLFDLAYQRSIRSAGFKILVVDDYNHLPQYECDILLNQNLGAEDYKYKVNVKAQRLVGPAYALLRREFRRAAVSNEWTECREKARSIGENVLVTMGGADTHNVTLKIVEALNRIETIPLNVKLLVGLANPHRDILLRAIASTSRIHYKLIYQGRDMVPLMDWADLAITAAGSTCLEFLAMGVPMLSVVISDNQQNIAQYFEKRDIAHNMGWYDEFTDAELAAVCENVLNDGALRGRWSERGSVLVNRCGACDVVGKIWTIGL